MTNPEPAGAGTAEIATRIVDEWIDAQTDADFVAAMAYDGGVGDDSIRRGLISAIASAITAAESRARERCAKIAEDYRHGNPFPTVYAAIAEAIHSSINPPGEEE